MKVLCNDYECVFNKHGQCTKELISLNEMCEDFFNYRLTDEYCHSFYKAVKLVDGGIAKALFKRGKKIEYQGLTFYTEDKVYENDDDFDVTEKTSGMRVEFTYVKKYFDKIMEKIQSAPKVKDLPLADMNDKGKWVLVESEGKE